MAFFSPITCEIHMHGGTGAGSGSMEQVSTLPSDRELSVSYVHEYVHFLQAVSSVAGLRILTSVLDQGVAGALILSGRLADGKDVHECHEILPLLASVADGAGATHPDLEQVVRFLRHQLNVLFQETDYAYSGSREPWELDRIT